MRRTCRVGAVLAMVAGLMACGVRSGVDAGGNPSEPSDGGTDDAGTEDAGTGDAGAFDGGMANACFHTPRTDIDAGPATCGLVPTVGGARIKHRFYVEEDGGALPGEYWDTLRDAPCVLARTCDAGIACVHPGWWNLRFPLTDEVRFAVDTLPVGNGLYARIYVGDDGSRLTDGTFIDLVHECPVSVQQMGTEWRLVPPTVSFFYHSVNDCPGGTADLAKANCSEPDVPYATIPGTAVVKTCPGDYLAIACQCGETPCPGASIIRALKAGPSVPLSDWKPATRGVAGSGRLTYSAFDVSCMTVPNPIQGVGLPYNDARWGQCRPQIAADGELRCVPWVGARLEYLDQQCTQPVYSDQYSGLRSDTVDGRVHIYDVPPPATDAGTRTTLYFRLADGGCAFSSVSRYRPLGPEVDAGAFVGLELELH